ncbi:MAG TPA: hypothetical protein VEJ87_10140 [Acidimicrobiales bacterium]|nr:hypothetical protein [Acidimicrobiales bacterium]
MNGVKVFQQGELNALDKSGSLRDRAAEETVIDRALRLALVATRQTLAWHAGLCDSEESMEILLRALEEMLCSPKDGATSPNVMS